MEEAEGRASTWWVENVGRLTAFGDGSVHSLDLSCCQFCLASQEEADWRSPVAVFLNPPECCARGSWHGVQ